MGLLDEMRNQKGENIRNNPLNDLEVKKKQLPDLSVRIDGDTHTRLLTLAHISGDSIKNVLKRMIQNEIDSFDAGTKDTFDKFYGYKIEEKLDMIKRKRTE
ncbi:hypothetical protein RW115_12095 [Macrococcus capreoli]